MSIKKVLTIAGSDCSGGAGIQADLKTFTVHKTYGMSVITSLTAQNTTGVYGVLDADPQFVAKQLDCVFQDIFPDAVKIGMVSNAQIISIIAQKLVEYKAKNIVIDPVMIATSGSKLLDPHAMDNLINQLLPLGDIITPNIPEAETLSNMSIKTKEDMLVSAQIIAKNIKGDVLIKGGHLEDCADDLLYSKGEFRWFSTPRINNPNTHGTGCTLSSAIACNIALGNDMTKSVALAKEYVLGAIKRGLDLGKGSGPLEHTYILK